jgi:methionyl-tRNA synthetase
VAASVVEADAAIERLAIHDAVTSIWAIVDALNGYITEQEPWALAKDPANSERLATVLNTATEGLRALAVLLSPFMPQATQKLWNALGVEGALGALTAQPIREAGTWNQIPAGTTVGTLEALFPRIESVAE